MASQYQHITSAYNTGPMFKTRGAWANDNLSADITGPGVLKDNSKEGNDGAVTGTVTRIKFNRCLYGVCCDDTNFVTLTGSVFDELQGWYRSNDSNGVWRFFEDAAEVSAIEKNGNDYQLKNGCYGLLMLSAEPVVFGGPDDFNDTDFDTSDFA